MMLYKYISKLESYKKYEQRRIILDSIMLTMFHEWARNANNPEVDTSDLWEKSQEASRTRNNFCNRHIIYTKIFDYIFKMNSK